LFLDARESIRIAPEVANIMAKELKQDNNWINNQIEAFELVAKNYYFKE
jgi:glycerol-3-phosphate dehydrogenase